jgi:hypothetical protein
MYFHYSKIPFFLTLYRNEIENQYATTLMIYEIIIIIIIIIIMSIQIISYHDMTLYGGSEDTAPGILNLGTGWR